MIDGDSILKAKVNPGCRLLATCPRDYGDLYFTDNCLNDRSGEYTQCCTDETTTTDVISNLYAPLWDSGSKWALPSELRSSWIRLLMKHLNADRPYGYHEDLTALLLSFDRNTWSYFMVPKWWFVTLVYTLTLNSAISQNIYYDWECRAYKNLSYMINLPGKIWRIPEWIKCIDYIILGARSDAC